MTDKIPVFDSWGNPTGDFIRSGNDSGVVWILLAFVFVLLLCLPVALPVAGLIWAYSQPKEFQNRRFLIFLCLFVLAMEICGFISLSSIIAFCGHYPESINNFLC